MPSVADQDPGFAASGQALVRPIPGLEQDKVRLGVPEWHAKQRQCLFDQIPALEGRCDVLTSVILILDRLRGGKRSKHIYAVRRLCLSQDRDVPCVGKKASDSHSRHSIGLAEGATDKEVVKLGQAGEEGFSI